MSNMSLQNSVEISSATKVITLPFPPIISAQDLIDKRSPERASAKSPNAFFVYRKAFVNYLQGCNHNLKMREVSSMAGLSWKAASREVKDAYKKIARDVERIIITQRRKKYEESRNRYIVNTSTNMFRPVYLESPYRHDSTSSLFPQQQQSMPVNSWYPSDVVNHVNQHFQPRPETIYEITSQYASLSSNLYENNQPIVTSSQVVENNQHYDYEHELFLASQESIQQNFTPINSAIDQFATDYFNENDYIHWQTQNNDEKQQDGEGF